MIEWTPETARLLLLLLMLRLLPQCAVFSRRRMIGKDDAGKMI